MLPATRPVHVAQRALRSPLLYLFHLLSFSLRTIRSHDIRSLGHITPPDGTTLVPKPKVVLFMHLPKCSGSTVRNIFYANGWTATSWSLTQRLHGWKANRILHSIHNYLRQNKSRIFVEWHLSVNFSFVPELEHYVRAMRPDVEFRSFTIIRKPTAFVASDGAFWMPHRPADEVIQMKPEFTLFGALNISYTPADGHAVCKQEPEFCKGLAVWEASSRGRKKGDGPTVLNVNAKIFPEDRTAAEQVAARVAGMRAKVKAVGCNPLVKEGVALLSPLSKVFLFEDNATLPSIYAAASQGDLDFRPMPPPYPTFKHSARTNPAFLAPYKTPEASAALELANRCSMILYTLLSQAISQGTPLADVPSNWTAAGHSVS